MVTGFVSASSPSMVAFGSLPSRDTTHHDIPVGDHALETIVITAYRQRTRTGVRILRAASASVPLTDAHSGFVDIVSRVRHMSPPSSSRGT